MASILSEAAGLYGRSPAEWATRRAENDALGEWAVLRPYKDLPGSDALDELTGRFWDAASADDWGAKLDDYLAAQVRSLAGIAPPGQ
jgi:hypothetical protein